MMFLFLLFVLSSVGIVEISAAPYPSLYVEFHQFLIPPKTWKLRFMFSDKFWP